MCHDYDSFFDRARIAEELLRNRKKTDPQQPPLEAAPKARAAEPKPVDEETIPVA